MFRRHLKPKTQPTTKVNLPILKSTKFHVKYERKKRERKTPMKTCFKMERIFSKMLMSLFAKSFD